jgi:hypothetical protein
VEVRAGRLLRTNSSTGRVRASALADRAVVDLVVALMCEAVTRAWKVLPTRVAVGPTAKSATASLRFAPTR